VEGVTFEGVLLFGELYDVLEGVDEGGDGLVVEVEGELVHGTITEL
jgi:hypothetical protein